MRFLTGLGWSLCYVAHGKCSVLDQNALTWIGADLQEDEDCDHGHSGAA